MDKTLAVRVWRSVQELGYFPNVLARQLVTGRSRLLGLIVPAIFDSFYAEVAQRFEEAALEHGCVPVCHS